MKYAFIILLSLLFTGCAGVRYGHFTHEPPVIEVRLAEEAARGMARAYPPAKTTLRLKYSPCDAFGVALMQALRQQGFGVIERVRPPHKADFNYVVDSLPPAAWRISLYYGHEQLSRAYTETNGTLTAISPWSHKESAHAQ